MSSVPRRALLISGAGAPAFRALAAGEAVADALRGGIARRKIPAVAAAFADRRNTLYSGAFGVRDASGVTVREDSIFRIASMTKPVTTVAALQLVEQGKVSLSEPVARHLPQFEGVKVLEGFDRTGKPALRPARTPVTLHHLLTQTSGLCYPLWDERGWRYASLKIQSSPEKPGPLLFEPGTRWQYGYGTAWAARLVEKLTGATLEAYFQEKILKPLGMADTTYVFPEAKFERLVAAYRRNAAGALQPNERRMPTRPDRFNGDGGLYSTAGDYVRFLQMILNGGVGSNGVRVLKAKTVESMLRNQIGDVNAGKMRSFDQASSSDVDFDPGRVEKWGYGLLLTTVAREGGRAAGSGAWAGMNNTYFWVDPKRGRCGVILMQYLPFADREAVGLLGEFERASYGAL